MDLSDDTATNVQLPYYADAADALRNALHDGWHAPITDAKARQRNAAVDAVAAHGRASLVITPMPCARAGDDVGGTNYAKAPLMNNRIG
ncbi:MAG TPA: hypothetical protein VGG99_09515 [Acetobacteraceae bacterium]